ncbi:2-oxoglutarate dehydrogenase E1 component [Alicyclobacillus sp. SO9]|uniref:2-oxoglutarate dehydrogenase E1 component n=1 Tax=Alicyclobacillus sp. SO9 TaxID=2665646 RepID=UPI0018E89EDB|nr:2-oxoglutarate dehydrogenase E1 component [Alicyclobacillus sp. SO9]QQE78856.1 2-oxoglutarate dehydrogenase E1 component [Alicyclobacillus sp. SO9]
MQQNEDLAPWAELSGPNLAYVLEVYDEYLKDANSVTDAYRSYFEKWGPPPDTAWQPLQVPGQAGVSSEAPSAGAAQIAGAAQTAAVDITKVSLAQELARNLREYGHLAARTNPLKEETNPVAVLEMAHYGLSEAELSNMPASYVWHDAPSAVSTALDAVRRLKQLYTQSLAFDFAHVDNSEEAEWLRQRVEMSEGSEKLSEADQRDLLNQLIHVDELEKFLQRAFVGQKRFSIEGVDMLVPMLDRLITEAVASGAKSVMMGMAHRGRLNTLAHILGKPYETIFSEFHTSVNKELVPSEGSMGINYGWSGDVKYHLGARRDVKEAGVREAHLVLANNPSHLEFVNPVVEGFARAEQDDRSHGGQPTQDANQSLAIVVHGDAAFPGEGIVAETLNLSGLDAYQTGGTIHIIANNQLGFTADADEGRSTRYASDLARGFEIPIVHVSADDPEACIAAVLFAHAYRQQFHKDFLIDLVGYRRWGHNEMDDPMPTQPSMYTKINGHPSVRQIYSQILQSADIVSEEETKHMAEQVQKKLQEAHQKVKREEESQEEEEFGEIIEEQAPKTGVSLEVLKEINEALLTRPSDFTVYNKLQRVLERRRKAFDDDKIDWAHAEALAFGSILTEGTPIRMTGQDSERGTFSQRHLVLHDAKTGLRYSPLEHLDKAKVSFALHNSPLSEAAVIGFEYGYGVQARDALVLWEAQFGDFSNAGQVIIDQFIASGMAKWKQPSGLVMLLPHGYEGQGPEHSSARLERYLQLSAEHNWRVVNPTSAAQYFHLLRSQAVMQRTLPRPLIVMTPKSLLRNQQVVSSREALTEGSFQPVLMDNATVENTDSVTRLVLSSGKVGVDFSAALREYEGGVPAWIAAARLEQIYPFPWEHLKQLQDRYPNLEEVFWMQEEPANMGSWFFVEPRLKELFGENIPVYYSGRSEQSSPAEGSANVHKSRQGRLMDQTLAAEHPAGGYDRRD